MIHKTKKEEGKKHITMPLRWEFRLFRLDSMPISAYFDCIGLFWPFQSPDDTALILAKLAQFNANRAELVRKKKKKTLKRDTDVRINSCALSQKYEIMDKIKN